MGMTPRQTKAEADGTEREGGTAARTKRYSVALFRPELGLGGYQNPPTARKTPGGAKTTDAAGSAEHGTRAKPYQQTNRPATHGAAGKWLAAVLALLLYQEAVLDVSVQVEVYLLSLHLFTITIFALTSSHAKTY